MGNVINYTGQAREVWNGDSGEYVAYDAEQRVVERRPLTEQERSELPEVFLVPDLQSIADQVARLAATVDDLIVASLEGGSDV